MLYLFWILLWNKRTNNSIKGFCPIAKDKLIVRTTYGLLKQCLHNLWEVSFLNLHKKILWGGHAFIIFCFTYIGQIKLVPGDAGCNGWLGMHLNLLILHVIWFAYIQVITSSTLVPWDIGALCMGLREVLILVVNIWRIKMINDQSDRELVFG